MTDQTKSSSEISGPSSTASARPGQSPAPRSYDPAVPAEFRVERPVIPRIPPHPVPSLAFLKSYWAAGKFRLMALSAASASVGTLIAVAEGEIVQPQMYAIVFTGVLFYGMAGAVFNSATEVLCDMIPVLHRDMTMGLSSPLLTYTV